MQSRSQFGVLILVLFDARQGWFGDGEVVRCGRLNRMIGTKKARGEDFMKHTLKEPNSPTRPSSKGILQILPSRDQEFNERGRDLWKKIKLCGPSR